jgi:hypothetical protein
MPAGRRKPALLICRVATIDAAAGTVDAYGSRMRRPQQPGFASIFTRRVASSRFLPKEPRP